MVDGSANVGEGNNDDEFGEGNNGARLEMATLLVVMGMLESAAKEGKGMKQGMLPAMMRFLSATRSMRGLVAWTWFA